MPDSDPTASDPSTGTTSSGTTSGDTYPKSGKGGPQPLTVFTGSHGLQADKPRAGEDAGQGDDPDQAGEPDSPDLRR